MDHQDRLKLAVEIAALGLGEVDYIADTITLDERAAGFFDLPANMPIQRVELHDRIHPDDRLDVETEVNCLLSPETAGFIVVTHRVIKSDGTIIWLNARKQVMFSGERADGTPKPLSGIVAIQDVTALKAAEAEVRYLLQEMTHRTKNTLNLVQSLARLTARNSDRDDFVPKLIERIDALGRNNSSLVNQDWGREDLRKLVESQLSPYTETETKRMLLDGPQITLNERAAQAIGMALHELATNAVKYGALSNERGNIHVSWRVDNSSENSFSLSWTESDGPPVEAPTRTGFGDMVIRRMAAASVRGKVSLEYRPTGAAWHLAAPLENVSADA
jgi:two-component sensor histidine kinase